MISLYLYCFNEFSIQVLSSRRLSVHRHEDDRKTPVFNTLRPGQNGRHFADDIFKCIFLNENAWIPVKISLKFVPRGPINNIPALVQIMAWCRPGDMPLSEQMMDSLPTHICVTRPQWGLNEDWEVTSAYQSLSKIFEKRSTVPILDTSPLNVWAMDIWWVERIASILPCTCVLLTQI